MNCRKTDTRVMTPANHNSSKQRDEPIRIPRNCQQLTQSAGKLRVQDVIGLGFALLKNWREIFKPIAKRSNLSRNHIVFIF